MFVSTIPPKAFIGFFAADNEALNAAKNFIRKHRPHFQEWIGVKYIRQQSDYPNGGRWFDSGDASLIADQMECLWFTFQDEYPEIAARLDVETAESHYISIRGNDENRQHNTAHYL